jgi:hypothetical protein
MHKIFLSLFVCFALVGTAVYCFADLSGQNMHLSGERIHSDLHEEEQVFVIRDEALISIGDNDLSASSAVVWVSRVEGKTLSDVGADYRVRAYLEGDVEITSGPKSRMTDISRRLVERGNSLFVTFIVSGQGSRVEA